MATVVDPTPFFPVGGGEFVTSSVDLLLFLLFFVGSCFLCSVALFNLAVVFFFFVSTVVVDIVDLEESTHTNAPPSTGAS